ncbi:MAG TPA: alpha/beta hydrolase [Eubacteriaceae bacterium]|nr:alpha/beta hydrolase [Eubacteriaceae bacterium]
MRQKKHFTNTDNLTMAYYHWPSEQNKGAFLILHGMAEHALRYEDFADYLVERGYDVYAFDYRGHGANQHDGVLGLLAKEKGWWKTLEDIKLMLDIAFEEHECVHLLGHSMGSLLARSYIIKYYDLRIKKVFFIGTTTGQNPLVLKAGKLLSKILANHPTKPSKVMNDLIFGGFAKSVPSANTTFDWLSTDEQIVQNYIKDPLCGFVAPAAFYRDLLTGTDYANAQKNLQKIDSGKELFLLSGLQDPVGNFGKEPKQLYKQLAAIVPPENLTLKLYENMRHEILNDRNRQKVYADILALAEDSPNTKKPE